MHDVTTAEVNVKEGEALWSKWLRLKRELTGEAIPNWNRIMQANSGKSLSELVELFIKKCYVDKLNTVTIDDNDPAPVLSNPSVTPAHEVSIPQLRTSLWRLQLIKRM